MAKRNITNIVIPVVSVLTLIMITYWILFPVENKTETAITYRKRTLPYHLLYPEKTIELPLELNEISGISHLGDKDLACVEDESGNIYILNYETGEVTGIHEFGKDRDYEDIAVMEDTVQDMMMKIYVLRSSGKIYRIKRLGLPNQKIKKYSTFLTKLNDAEGLCYYKEMNALLIACKNSPSLNNRRNTVEDKKAIYIFDLNKKVMLSHPLLVFDFNAIKNVTGNTIHAGNKFRPSGIAVHPVSGHIYIISSVGNWLLVINKTGDIINLTSLNKSLFPQPEGICFLPNGDLFISNEGRQGRGKVLYFKYND